MRGYPEFTRLNDRVGGVLDDPSHGLVDSAANGFQPFANSQHGSHLVAIRRALACCPQAKCRGLFASHAGCAWAAWLGVVVSSMQRRM